MNLPPSASLSIDWCSYKATQYAVQNWHYSGSLPTPPLVRIGVWEDGIFVGCIIFSRGANKDIGTPYGLSKIQVCELSRVALNRHKAPVTQMLSPAIKMLKEQNPGLRLIVSYADPFHDHHGGIYQAGSWFYSGQTAPAAMYFDSKGKRYHPRQVSPSGLKVQYGQLRSVPKPADLRKVKLPGKHRYLMPLDKSMRRRIKKLAKPYPSGQGVNGDTLISKSEIAGSIPAARP